jgi:hypothetical protein
MEKSPNSSTQFVRSGLWQRVNGTGLERFELLRGPGSWTLKGTILTLGDRGPAEVVYELLCDAVWRTRHGFFLLRDQSGDRFLRVIADNGRWFENGQKRKDLADCIDIDLGWSPSSNTLPIRRLGLKVGARSGQLVMAWIRFPELTIERLQQQYERVSERRYMYTSRGGSFKARIDVDEEELVLDYEGAWLRVG